VTTMVSNRRSDGEAAAAKGSAKDGSRRTLSDEELSLCAAAAPILSVPESLLATFALRLIEHPGDYRLAERLAILGIIPADSEPIRSLTDFLDRGLDAQTLAALLASCRVFPTSDGERTFSDYLAREGFLDPGDVLGILEASVSTGLSTVQYLIDNNIAKTDRILEALAGFSGMPVAGRSELDGGPVEDAEEASRQALVFDLVLWQPKSRPATLLAETPVMDFVVNALEQAVGAELPVHLVSPRTLSSRRAKVEGTYGTLPDIEPEPLRTPTDQQAVPAAVAPRAGFGSAFTLPAPSRTATPVPTAPPVAAPPTATPTSGTRPQPTTVAAPVQPRAPMARPVQRKSPSLYADSPAGNLSNRLGGAPADGTRRSPFASLAPQANGGRPVALTPAEYLPVVTDLGEAGEAAQTRVSRAFLPDKRSPEQTPWLPTGPIADRVRQIVAEALSARATDIHLDPFRDYLRVRIRVDGILHELYRIDNEMRREVIARIKILANLDITERRMAQDGQITMQVDDRTIDMRVATIPVKHGERVELRLANLINLVEDLGSLGLQGRNAATVDGFLQQPHGIVLATGPVGSGKTTTLYSCLAKLDSSSYNIMSIEDPVEVDIEGANQVNVNYKIGFDFVAGLRGLLRHDPDVILIGEIRDDETARIAIRAAMTGMLVFSSLHTNDAPGAVTTLYNFHLPPHLVANGLLGVVAQRLMRRLCDQCAVSYEARDAEIEYLYRDGATPPSHPIKLRRGRGCPACMQSGYLGRTGIFEVLKITPEIRIMILEQVSERAIRERAIADGMVTLHADARAKVLAGATSVQEVARVLGS
jgi:type II secretory ATPase GspE/PulE/Tfp pilus assembly ATPase PilB-like protein